jgi:dipeptidyl aminopeptidase/acylaminoacyl peptidase
MIRLISQHLIQLCAPLILTCVGASTVFAQGTLPAEVYAGHPQYSDVSLSPDGNRVALAVSDDAGDHLTTFSLTDRNERRNYFMPRLIVTGVDWLNDDAVFAMTYGNYLPHFEDNFDHNVVTDIDWYGLINPLVGYYSYIFHPATNDGPRIVGGRNRPLANYGIVDFVPNEDGHFLVSRASRGIDERRWGYSTNNEQDNEGRAMERVVIRTSLPVLSELGTQHTAKWFTDGRGNIVARVELLESGTQVVLAPEGRKYREVVSLTDQAGSARNIIGLSHDGTSLVVQARINNRLGLYPISLADGSWGDPLFLGDGFDFSGVVLNEKSFRVEGVVYQQGMIKRTQYFSPEMQSLQETLEDVFSGHTIEIKSQSTDGGTALLEISSPTRPPAVGIYDRDAETIDTVSEAYPELRAGPFGEVREHSYTTADGSELVGVLTLPSGVPHLNLPLVVLGDAPSAPTFDKFAHFLSTRGYAVFRPGVREIKRLTDLAGSDELADWVRMIQEDYTAGVNDLTTNGIVDPARVCIHGKGLDGYTALISTVYSSDRFACAISVNGITDLQRHIDWARHLNGFSGGRHMLSYDSALVRYHHRFDRDDIESFSPVARAADVGASVLLLGYDRGSQAPGMAVSLRREGKPVEYVEFIDNAIQPAEDREQNVLLEYSTIERYLREQIGP